MCFRCVVMWTARFLQVVHNSDVSPQHVRWSWITSWLSQGVSAWLMRHKALRWIKLQHIAHVELSLCPCSALGAWSMLIVRIQQVTVARHSACQSSFNAHLCLQKVLWLCNHKVCPVLDAEAAAAVAMFDANCEEQASRWKHTGMHTKCPVTGQQAAIHTLPHGLWQLRQSFWACEEKLEPIPDSRFTKYMVKNKYRYTACSL